MFACDGAAAAVAARREAGFLRLAATFRERNPASAAALERTAPGVSDLQFIARYRVPFQFSPVVREKLASSVMVTASAGVTLTDLDGNRYYDLTGSYGVNVLGNDFYKTCLEAAEAKVGQLGPVLGPYHPVVEDNVARLLEISGLDEVSFHMSGTEAVMQAVRLARYHTGRSHLVRFAGAYHGWWDEVQPGVGNPGRVGDVHTLSEMSERSLQVIRTRRDIACVLVNPLQAFFPNASAPGDGALVASNRNVGLDLERYGRWLRELRAACSENGAVLIFDEVFVGFRIAYGGAQAYFDVHADLVTYGKTLGGGLPVGVVCGRSTLMKRYRDDRPADVCFARGTFNAHPLVMAAMNEFLVRSRAPEWQAVYRDLDAVWTARAARLNAALEQAGVPVRVANFSSIFTVLYSCPSRFNWMFQFYLNAAGLLLGWTGTGRLIFSLAYSEADFDAVAERFVAAAVQMQRDDWWYPTFASNRQIHRQVLREILRAGLASFTRNQSHP